MYYVKGQDSTLAPEKHGLLFGDLHSFVCRRLLFCVERPVVLRCRYYYDFHNAGHTTSPVATCPVAATFHWTTEILSSEKMNRFLFANCDQYLNLKDTL